MNSSVKSYLHTTELDAPRLAEVGALHGVIEIAKERLRQVEAEGFDPRHDDGYTHDELVRAAACYLFSNIEHSDELSPFDDGWQADACSQFWPWDVDWFKPKSREENLRRAGALIAAELDRLERIKAESAGG